jgi:heme-degrading monooxygenase HmoA
MILELADFHTPDPDDFPAAIAEVGPVLAASRGYLGHDVYHGIESPDRFVLLVRWESVDAHHTFRQSAAFDVWKERMAIHRTGIVVEHFAPLPG